MPQVYKEPGRHVNGPLYVVERRIRTPWHKHQPLPVAQVPQNQRTGMLHVIFVAGSLEVRHNGQTSNVYPEGAHYSYERSCEVHLEVLPRGRSDREYERWVEQPPYIRTSARVRMLSTTRNTPIVVSREVWAFAGTTSPSTDAHVTLLSPKDVRRHLLGVLPYIGVHPSDVSAAYSYIETLLTRGRRELGLPR